VHAGVIAEETVTDRAVPGAYATASVLLMSGSALPYVQGMYMGTLLSLKGAEPKWTAGGHPFLVHNMPTVLYVKEGGWGGQRRASRLRSAVGRV